MVYTTDILCLSLYLSGSYIYFIWIKCFFSEQGYLHSSLENHYDEYGITLYKYKKGAQYNFDFQYVLEQLEDYVYSKNTSERFRALANPVDNVFGLNTYRCLNDHFECVLKKVKHFDIRPLHIFWEHKKCMVSRIEYLEHLNYLNPQNEFSKSYKVIEERTDRQRIMMLKFLITNQNHIVEAAIKEMDRIAQAERRLLERMLDLIKKQMNRDKKVTDLGAQGERQKST